MHAAAVFMYREKQKATACMEGLAVHTQKEKEKLMASVEALEKEVNLYHATLAGLEEAQLDFVKDHDALRDMMRGERADMVRQVEELREKNVALEAKLEAELQTCKARSRLAEEEADIAESAIFVKIEGEEHGAGSDETSEFLVVDHLEE